MECFVKIVIDGETDDELWSQIDSIGGIQMVERSRTASQAVSYYRVEKGDLGNALRKLGAYGEAVELDVDEKRELMIRYNTMQRIVAARL